MMAMTMTIVIMLLMIAMMMSSAFRCTPSRLVVSHLFRCPISYVSQEGNLLGVQRKALEIM